MKYLLFGCTLMLCGTLGGMGWILACVGLVEPGARGSVLSCLGRASDWIVVAVFLAVAAAGVILAVRGLRTREKA